MTDKKYTSDDIEVLSDRDHSRLRIAIFLGDATENTYNIPIITETGFDVQPITFIPAVYKAIGEIIDNSIDEFSQLSNQRSKILKIEAEPEIGQYAVSDNGRGVPIDKHKTGKYTPEVVFGSLRSGRNFTDDKSKGVIGQNGVGSSIVNFCSEMFQVDIYRDGKHYSQRFTDGALKVGKPVIKDKKSSSGTTISFTLDPSVFTNISLPPQFVRNRAIEIALTNPSITVQYNNETFRFKNGMADLVKRFAGATAYSEFSIDTDDASGTIYVVPNSHDGSDERMFTWVNSSFLFDGGKCNVQFTNAFMDKAVETVQKLGSKAGITVTKNDVRSGLTFIADLKIKNPSYDSQSKTRLSGPDLRKELVQSVDDGWKAFAKNCSTWIQECYENAVHKHNFNATKKLQDEQSKSKGKKLRVEGLMDATSKVRSECMLFVVEGESAKSQISEVRDPATMGAYALTGKINNVRGATPAQVAKMEKVVDLLRIIGLVPGKKVTSRSALNYGKLIISTDADYDGGDIFTILVNLFHTFWPELFSPEYEPFVYRLVAPNVCLVKGTTRVHFPTRLEYEKSKTKYKDKGWSVNYFKGLGSMSPQDWDMILSGETDTMIPIIDDGKMNDTLELLFGDDTDARKRWLQREDNN